MEPTLQQTGIVLKTLRDWLMTNYFIDRHDATLISYWLFHFSYHARLKLQSDRPIVDHLIELAKVIAWEWISLEKLTELAVPFE